jgi:hypothetical protein
MWRDLGKVYRLLGLAHPMSLTELALLDSRRPSHLGDIIGLTLLIRSYILSTVPIAWRHTYQCGT